MGKRIQRLEDRMNAEMRHHIEEHIEELISKGCSPEEARKAAMREFGNIEVHKEDCRDSIGIRIIDTFIRDTRFAFRQMAKRKLFTFTVIATLALGIGINTGVFNLVNAVLFKAPDYPNGERLVTITGQNLESGRSNARLSYPDFEVYHETSSTFEYLIGTQASAATLNESEVPAERATMALVSPDTFNMLGVQPIVGRDFTDADARPESEKTLIISHRLWQQRYDGSPDVLNRPVTLNGEPATIIGVMPERFHFPANMDIWTPLSNLPELQNRNARPLLMFGTLKPGVTITQANSELATIAMRLENDFPDTNEHRSVLVQTLNQRQNGGFIRLIFLAMLVAVGLVLLIACANVANMFLSRSISRKYELSMRSALGASRSQILRQLLTESVLICCIGGALGLLIAWGGTRVFDEATLELRPSWIAFGMDLTTFAYIAGISILSGIVSGIVPALKSSKTNLDAALKESSRSASPHRNGKIMGSMVITQLAFTFILLVGTGLFMQSYLVVQNVNEFLPKDKILTAAINLSQNRSERYATAEQQLQFYERLVEDLKTIPGVTHAFASSNIPGGSGGQGQIEIEGNPVLNPSEAPEITYTVQSLEALNALNMRLIKSGDLSGFSPNYNGEPVAIATQHFANSHWPDGEVLGKRFRFLANEQPGPWHTVVGVTRNLITNLETGENASLVFIPPRQEPRPNAILVLMTDGDPLALTSNLRRTVQDADSSLALHRVMTFQQIVDRGVFFIPLFGSAFLVFSLAGLLIASIGVYAVVAQSTGYRIKEIGIRLALGATTKRIIKLVLSKGTRQLAAGISVGLIGAYFSTRFLQGVIVAGVSLRDPLVFGTVFILLSAIGYLACWLPARRASKLKPATVMQED